MIDPEEIKRQLAALSDLKKNFERQMKTTQKLMNDSIKESLKIAQDVLRSISTKQMEPLMEQKKQLERHAESIKTGIDASVRKSFEALQELLRRAFPEDSE